MFPLAEKLVVLGAPRARPALDVGRTPGYGKKPGGDSDHRQISQ